MAFRVIGERAPQGRNATEGVPDKRLKAAIVGIMPHTTTLRGSRFEVAVAKPFLKPGAFDAQGLASVPRTRLIRRLGRLQPDELGVVEEAVRTWLGL